MSRSTPSTGLPPFWTRVPGGFAIDYPGVEATNPYDLYGPDTLASLHRRALIAEADPKDRAAYVTKAEIRRVLRRHRTSEVPTCVRRLLARPGGSGRRPPSPVRALTRQLFEEWTLERYCRLRALLKAQTPQRRARWRRACRISEDCATPGLMAADLARRRYFPEKSARRLLNCFSEAKGEALSRE